MSTSRLKIVAALPFSALLLLAFALPTAASSPTNTLERQLAEAEAAFDRGEPRMAESFYRGAVREGLLILGWIASAEEDFQAAVDRFSAARRAAATDITAARHASALASWAVGEREEPLKELRLLAHEHDGDVRLLSDFVLALARAGKGDELKVELDQLRRIAPGSAEKLAALESPAAFPEPTLDLGPIKGLDAESRTALQKRTEATLEQVSYNLEVLQWVTGFRGKPSKDRPADSERSFGSGLLPEDPSAIRVEPFRPNPVEWLASFRSDLHPQIEQIDSGDSVGAERALRRRLDSEEDGQARTLLAIVLILTDRREEGASELERVIEGGGDALQARQILSRLHWHGNRRDEAKTHLLQAADLGPLDRDLSLALAQMELADGRTAAANRQLRSLHRRYRSVEASIRLSEVFSDLGNEKRALDYLEDALAGAPSSEEVLARHARLALELSLAPIARRSVEPLARLRPESAEYQYFLGRIWAEMGKMGEASEALLKSVALDPDYIPSFLPLGLALNHESRFEEARDYLIRYVEVFPDDLEASAGLAESLERLGETERAESRAREILAAAPDHARANLVLGLIHLSRNDPAAAREVLEQAVVSDPRLAKAHYQLSLACNRLRDRDCAQTHLAAYKKAKDGLEATVVEMKAVETETTLMKKEPQDPSP